MTKPSTPIATAQPQDCFEAQASQVLLLLRRALAAVLTAVPGLDARSSATDVQRALRINSKLSWQLHKFANTKNPLEVACHLPKPAAMSRFSEAARRKSVPAVLIDELQRNVDEFNRLIADHAGDRATFDSMVGNISGDTAAAQLNVQHRRDAFRAQSQIWGVQASAMASLMIFRSGEKVDTVDGVIVGGHINLRRFRHDARWILFSRSVASDKLMLGSLGALPLNPEDFKRYGAPLLSQFCSQPAGAFRMVETPQHVRCIEAMPDDIGNNSVATYLSGEVWRNVGYTNAENRRWLIARASMRIPVQVLYHDIMVHRDLPVVPEPEIRQFGDLRTGDDTLIHSPSEQLPLYDTITPLGRGVDGVFANDVPRYPELAAYAHQCVGWDPSEFDVYRCRIEYPVLPATVVIRFRVRE